MFQNNPAIHYMTYCLGLQSALTQTTRREQDCLASHAKGRERLVEIGVWHGVNTRRFRESMSADGVLYAVDPFPSGRFGVRWERLIAVREAAQIQNGELHFLEMFSHDAVLEFDRIDGREIDFMFIDGDHSYEGVRMDWTLWSPKIARGGVVALHDSRSYAERQIDHVGPRDLHVKLSSRTPRFV